VLANLFYVELIEAFERRRATVHHSCTGAFVAFLELTTGRIFAINHSLWVISKRRFAPARSTGELSGAIFDR
jgi:hypothetical protein